jgi:hypothetical protein
MKPELLPYEHQLLQSLEQEFALEPRLLIGLKRSLELLSRLFQQVTKKDTNDELWAGHVVIISERGSRAGFVLLPLRTLRETNPELASNWRFPDTHPVRPSPATSTRLRARRRVRLQRRQRLAHRRRLDAVQDPQPLWI